MGARYLVACMPSSDVAERLYFDVLKPLMTETERLRLISYLDVATRENFDREIRTWIHLSNGVVAILDKTNLNVVYEIGVAMGFGKPVILLAQGLEDVPAMLRSKNVVTFQPDNLESERLRNKLITQLKAILYGSFIDQRFQDHAAVLASSDGLPTGTGDLEPDDPEQSDPDHLEYGINAYHLKNYRKAIVHLERAMEEGSRNADTYYYLSDSHFLFAESLRPGERQRSAYQKMQHHAHEGTKFFANDKRLRKTLGLSCMKLGDFDRAEKLFTELMAQDPEYIDAIYNLACLYALQQKRSHCLHYLSAVFGKNPEWRYLARLDPDFDSVWKDELIQRVMFPCPIRL